LALESFGDQEGKTFAVWSIEKFSCRVLLYGFLRGGWWREDCIPAWGSKTAAVDISDWNYRRRRCSLP